MMVLVLRLSRRIATKKLGVTPVMRHTEQFLISVIVIQARAGDNG